MNKQIPTAVVPTHKGRGGRVAARSSDVHGYAKPEGPQKLSCGSAKPSLRSNPMKAHHVEWFGPFGWTTSYKVMQWFDERYEEYVLENKLKIRAQKEFHPVARFEFRSPDYNLNNMT